MFCLTYGFHDIAVLNTCEASFVYSQFVNVLSVWLTVGLIKLVSAGMWN